MVLYRTRRVSIERQAIMVLAIGIIVFLAGCGYAIYRDMEDEKNRDLQVSSENTIETLFQIYGQRSGAISLSGLETDPSALEDEGPFDGKVALIKIDTYDQREIEIKVPNEKDFDDHSRTREESSTEMVPLDMGSGMIIPARMEVTIYG